MLARAIYKEEKGETETKRALDYLRMPKLQEILTTGAIACHYCDRLAVLQMFALLFYFEEKDIEQLFKETVCK